MIAKIAVSAATFAIDKPYSYRIPSGLELQPGMRVQIPFGRGNRRTEGVVLALEQGDEEKLKFIDSVLDAQPLLDYLDDLRDKSLASSTIARHLIALKMLFRYLMRLKFHNQKNNYI